MALIFDDFNKVVSFQNKRDSSEKSIPLAESLETLSPYNPLFLQNIFILKPEIRIGFCRVGSRGKKAQWHNVTLYIFLTYCLKKKSNTKYDGHRWKHQQMKIQKSVFCNMLVE